jgi:beta-fructofuranosidase
VRPQFHFTARSGWINDPHGITARDGGYDVFYQYVPGRTEWGPNCHWGHARGTDLFSLVERGPALLPGEGDDGIWTGSLVTDSSGTRIFYTSVGLDDIAIGRVRVARPTDDSWDSWVKDDGVLAQAPEGFELVGYRDPFLRRDPDAWRMFLGAGDADGRALALSYTSPDLETWTYEGVALERNTAERDPVWAGAMWECPQIVDIDGRAVMISSAWDRDVLNYAAYAIGTYDRGRFEAHAWGRLTFGPSYYAPSFFRDAAGRPAITLWMRGVDDVDAGWAGAHSVPHVLELDGDVLVARPHLDLESYRAAPVAGGLVDGTAADVVWGGEGRLTIASGDRVLATVEGTLGEIVVHVPEGEWTGTWAVPRARGDIRVIVDAGSVEISTDRGLFGAGIPAPENGLTVAGEGATVFPLVRS